MAIKLPKEMLEKHDIEVSIPAPTMECVAEKNGALKLYANYDTSLIEKFAHDLAHEMNEKFDEEVLAELMKLNGYAKERTCEMSITKQGPRYVTYHFSCCDEFYVESMTDSKADSLPGTVCPYCGAKVVE